MSSYQQMYYNMGASQFQDSRPDYLTCGYCTREFLLANITLFIAHKAGGCEADADSSRPELIPDTSSPLTCSICSRVFLTARGLLHHAEEAHSMRLCFHKGPLIIPENRVSPPPAHTSVNNSEYDVFKRQNVFESLTASSKNSGDGTSDQPTDLSMTCSSKLGKALLKYSDNECNIIIKPAFPEEIEDLRKAHPPSSSSQMRTTMDGQLGSADTFNTVSKNFDSVSDFYPTSFDGISEEGNYLQNDSQSSLEEEVMSMKPEKDADSEVNVIVTAQYEKEKLCCVSLKTEKGTTNGEETENDTIPKSICDSACREMNCKPDTPAAGVQSETSQLIYKFPKHIPQNPDSAKPSLVKTLNSSRECCSNDSRKHQSISSTVASDSTSNNSSQSDIFSSPPDSTAFSVSSSVPQYAPVPLKVHGSGGSSVNPHSSWNDAAGFYPDKNIEHYIPTPVSDDITADEFQILNTKSPSSSSSAPPAIIPQNQCHNYSPVANSPRLMTPQSGFGASHSAFDMDMSPLPHTSAAENVNTTSIIDSQSFSSSDITGVQAVIDATVLTNTGVIAPLSPFSNSYPDDISSQAVLASPNTISRQKSRDSILLLDSTELKRLLSTTEIEPKRERSAAQQPKDSFAKRSSFENGGDSQKRNSVESTESPENTASDPLTDTRQLYGSRLLKKRRYPTSKPFKCNNCDQAFNQRIHLKKHMSKHTGVKPFKCFQCDYSTVERSHLRVHFRTHTGEKPFGCPYCRYATAQNSTLKIHMKRHHVIEQMTDGEAPIREGKESVSQISSAY